MDSRPAPSSSACVSSRVVHPAQEPSRSIEPAKATSTSTTAIDDYIHDRMHKRHIPGVSVAIVQDGKVVSVQRVWPGERRTLRSRDGEHRLSARFGDQDVHRRRDHDARGGGQTQARRQDHVRLPDLPAAWKDVTVRQLLNHTSGIKSYTSVRDFFKTARKDYTQREILDLVTKEPLEFTPGEKWNYSNTGYFLLGMLIEKVTGKTYGEFMAERIFKPLGMTQTRVNDLHAIIPNRARATPGTARS